MLNRLKRRRTINEQARVVRVVHILYEHRDWNLKLKVTGSVTDSPTNFIAMKKYRIVAYDDLAIIDDTDMWSEGKEQLKAVATNLFATNSDAETVEVYDTKADKMILKFGINRKGKVIPMKVQHHPNWGGRREGGGRKKSANPLNRRIYVNVDEETDNFLSEMDSKTRPAWLRAAIKEKREREQQEKGSQ